jgi:hypothetical protein
MKYEKPLCYFFLFSVGFQPIGSYDAGASCSRNDVRFVATAWHTAGVDTTVPTKRVGVAAVTTNAQGNPVHGGIELTGGVAVDAGGGDPPSVPPPYFKNVTPSAGGRPAVTGVNTLARRSRGRSPSTSDDGQRALRWAVLRAPERLHVNPSPSINTGSHSFPNEPRRFRAGMHNQCARSATIRRRWAGSIVPARETPGG